MAGHPNREGAPPPCGEAADGVGGEGAAAGRQAAAPRRHRDCGATRGPGEGWCPAGPGRALGSYHGRRRGGKAGRETSLPIIAGHVRAAAHGEGRAARSPGGAPPDSDGCLTPNG